MATLRNLKIKTGTCKRLVKEFHSYEKEVEREAAKTADMKDKGADPYDLKQQVWHLLSLPCLQSFVLLERTDTKVRVDSNVLFLKYSRLGELEDLVGFCVF